MNLQSYLLMFLLAFSTLPLNTGFSERGGEGVTGNEYGERQNEKKKEKKKERMETYVKPQPHSLLRSPCSFVPSSRWSFFTITP